MAAASRHTPVRVRVSCEEEWQVRTVGVQTYFFVMFARRLLLYDYLLNVIFSSIIRSNTAEEALGALKSGLAKASPDSFMLWLHR